MSDAISGAGVVLNWNGHDVAEVLEIGELKVTSEFKDVTPHGTSRWRRKLPTLMNAENIPIKFNFIVGDTDGQRAMMTDCWAQTSRTIIITFPDDITATWTVTGYIANLGISGFTPDGSVELSGELVQDGEPTFAEGESTGMSALSVIEENAGGAVTPIPTFAIGTFTYSLTVNTLSDYVKFTPTAAAHTITITCGTHEETVTSGAQSGEITLGAAGSVTTITVKVQQTGKVAKTYTFYVTRP
jgi:hypothetical protein